MIGRLINFYLNFSVDKRTKNLHIKPTDTHQYLQVTSSQPSHIKSSSMVYIQALRVNKICSSECNFRKHISEIKK